jgi:hypothetical protein
VNLELQQQNKWQNKTKAKRPVETAMAMAITPQTI